MQLSGLHARHLPQGLYGGRHGGSATGLGAIGLVGWIRSGRRAAWPRELRRETLASIQTVAPTHTRSVTIRLALAPFFSLAFPFGQGAIVRNPPCQH